MSSSRRSTADHPVAIAPTEKFVFRRRPLVEERLAVFTPPSPLEVQRRLLDQMAVRVKRREPPPAIHGYYNDLGAIKAIMEDLAPPAQLLLLTGLFCDWTYQLHGWDEKARLETLKEFARGVRIEIRGR